MTDATKTVAIAADVTTARLSRRHNDANVPALGARIIGFETARDGLAVSLTIDHAPSA